MNKYRFMFSSIIICVPLLFLAGCTAEKSSARYQPVLEAYVGFWNTGNFDGIEDILHPDFELRMTPKFEPEKGIETFKESVQKWRTAYPDFHIEVNEVMYSVDKAAARWTITATNTGPGWHPATGKPVNVPGISIIHLKEGKIIDEWIAGNNIYWLSQLGFELKSPFEK